MVNYNILRWNINNNFLKGNFVNLIWTKNCIKKYVKPKSIKIKKEPKTNP